MCSTQRVAISTKRCQWLREVWTSQTEDVDWRVEWRDKVFLITQCQSWFSENAEHSERIHQVSFYHLLEFDLADTRLLELNLADTFLLEPVSSRIVFATRWSSTARSLSSTFTQSLDRDKLCWRDRTSNSFCSFARHRAGSRVRGRACSHVVARGHVRCACSWVCEWSHDRVIEWRIEDVYLWMSEQMWRRVNPYWVSISSCACRITRVERQTIFLYVKMYWKQTPCSEQWT